MASLNQHAERIASALGRPSDHEFKERAKDAIRNLRATRLRQSAEKNGLDPYYSLSYTAELITVDITDNCFVDLGCPVLRTKYTIAEPVRFKTDVPFTFVGGVDGTEFTFLSDLSKLRHMKLLRYMGETFYYALQNKYIYLYNAKRIKYITLTSLFVNPEEAVNVCANGACYTDDDEFPLPSDLVEGIITELLKTHFGLTQPIDTEVNVDKPNKE